MAKFKQKKISKKEIWEKFVLSNNPRSFLQSWNWGETNQLMGKEIFRLGFYRGRQLVGVTLLIKEEARRGRHLLIPGGPIIDWENKDLVKFFLQSIKGLAKKERAWFVRLRPELLDTDKNQRFFSSLGFIPAPMHLHAENTWVLDVTPSEDDLLKGMRKSTRYEVRKSLKSGLSLEMTVDEKKSKVLKRLQDLTVARHKFVGFSEKIFKAQLKTFGSDDQAVLFLCKKGREVLVAAIIIFYGDTAYYHHSASTIKYKKLSASYFLQWQVIKDAKRRGIKYYNFWGISPEGKKNHRFYGVTVFKTGFGGVRVDWLHAHDLPVSPLYLTTYFFERARKFIRRL